MGAQAGSTPSSSSSVSTPSVQTQQTQPMGYGMMGSMVGAGFGGMNAQSMMNTQGQQTPAQAQGPMTNTNFHPPQGMFQTMDHSMMRRAQYGMDGGVGDAGFDLQRAQSGMQNHHMAMQTMRPMIEHRNMQTWNDHPFMRQWAQQNGQQPGATQPAPAQSAPTQPDPAKPGFYSWG